MKTTHALMTAGALLGMAAIAVSQDGLDFGEMPAVEPAEHQIAPAFDPSVFSQERWMETLVPGEEHKLLGKLVGEWDVEQKLWMGGPEPQVTKMTSKTEWILGGKHIRETLVGTLLGQPFEGMGVTSYDKFAGQYVFFWADSMGTGTYLSRGFANQDGSAIEAYGTMDEPMLNMRGKTVKYVLRTIDENSHAFEIHDLHIGGDNTKVMEMVYTRK